MKLLIMCEGPNELKIINILLENQKLKFTSDDLLGLRPCTFWAAAQKTVCFAR